MATASCAFGDTGPDTVEKATRLADVWTAVAERARQKRLKAIVIESSLHQRPPRQPAVRPSDAALAAGGVAQLDKAAGGNALKDLPVVVSHIKYSLTREQPQQQMLRELEAGNDIGVRFVAPEQGARWHFK